MPRGARDPLPDVEVRPEDRGDEEPEAEGSVGGEGERIQAGTALRSGRPGTHASAKLPTRESASSVARSSESLSARPFLIASARTCSSCSLRELGRRLSLSFAVPVQDPRDGAVDRSLALLASSFAQLLAEKADHISRHLQHYGRHEHHRGVDPEAEHLVLAAAPFEGLRILEVRLARRPEERQLLGCGLLDGRARQRGDERVVLSRAHRASSLAAATE